MKQTDRAGRGFAAACFAAGCLMLAALAAQVTLNCDDYMYGLFTKYSLQDFLQRTKWHYQAFNGRALVHFMLEMQLWIGRQWYALLCPLMLGFAFCGGLKLLLPEQPRTVRLALAGIGLAAVAALPAAQLRESVMWLSAGYNYIFPLVLLTGTLLLAHRRETLGVWQAVLTFLAGATTEQFGVITCVFLGLYWLIDLIQTRRWSWYRFLLPVLAACGTLTIVLAPGTWVRMGNEVDGGLRSVLRPSVLIQRMQDYLKHFSGKGGAPAAVTLALALCGVNALWFRQGSKLLGTGLPAAAVYLALLLSNHEAKAAVFAIGALTLLGAGMLFSEETREAGVWTLAAIASQLMVLTANTVSCRTALPGEILLFCVCLALADVPRRHCRPAFYRIGAGMVLAALLVTGFPALRGFHANAVIERKNEAVLRDQSTSLGVIDCSGDPDFRFLSYLDRASYLKQATEYYGTPLDKRISYTSTREQVAGLYGDHRFGSYAIEHDGKVWFPVLYTTPLLGDSDCRRDYINHCFRITFRDQHILITEGGSIFTVDAQTDEVVEQIGKTPIYQPGAMAYMPAETFETVFGIHAQYSADENIYDLSVS